VKPAKSKDGTHPGHVCRATFTLETAVNDGPIRKWGVLTMRDGDVLTIIQPVEVTFQNSEPPITRGNEK
jgi:hypothetical protein